MHPSPHNTDRHHRSPGALNAAASLDPAQRAMVKKLMPLLYTAMAVVLVVVFIARASFAAPQSSFKGVMYDGKPFFVHGVNLPWIRWGCDFGSACDIRETEGEIRKAFADFRANHINVVRWWLFPGNPVVYPGYGSGNIVTLVDSSGKPLDFHPDVYRDIEYVLDLAAEYDLKLNFTIYSSHMDLPASWKEHPEHRQALADLLGRLAGRFAGRPELFAWELFNEPEAGLGNPEDSNPYARNIKELTRLVIAAQRQAMAGASPRALINLGPDRVKPAHFAFWKSLDVDFWSPHFYDNMTGETNALATTADAIRAAHGITQPILLGELYLGRGAPPPNDFVPQSVNLDPLARYEEVLARGYAGAWGWAYRPQNDRLTVDLAAARTFAERHPDLIGPP